MNKLRTDFLIGGAAVFLVGNFGFLFRQTSCGLLDLACHAQNFGLGIVNFALVLVGAFIFVLGVLSPFMNRKATLGGFARYLAKDALVNSVFGILLIPGTPEDAVTGGLSIIVGLAYFAFKAVQYFFL